jgi:outer membrane protein OmpA-like peptidoglycan-associated protein
MRGVCLVLVLLVSSGTVLCATTPQYTPEEIIEQLRGGQNGVSGEQDSSRSRGFNIGGIKRPSPTEATTPGTPAATTEPAADLLLTFELNSAKLTEQAVANARSFATALIDPRLRDSSFEIEGHTDASGSRPYNLALSRRRAEAVKTFLVSQGISAGRLRTIGYGPDRLLDPANPRSGVNRRVIARARRVQ